MAFLSRIFSSKPPSPPLPPLADPILGHLVWDEDSEGWVGEIRLKNGAARLYIGAGTSQQYPSEAMLTLLRAPYKAFNHLAEVASGYLLENMDLDAWKADPTAFVVDGLESYEHFLSDGTYTVTFTNGDDEAVWKVHFENMQPVGCGVDD